MNAVGALGATQVAMRPSFPRKRESSSCFDSFRFCENRLASMRVRPASLRAGSFSLLAQRKVTKRKGTLTAAVTRASCARDFASALRGLPTAHPCADGRLIRILRITLRAFSARARRGQEGALKSQSAAFLAAEATVPRASAFCFALASARRSALPLFFRAPSAAVDGGRQSPQGRAHDAPAFAVGTGNVPSANLGRRSRTFRAGCAEGVDAGLPFLLVTSLWASKEKLLARRDAGRTTHGRESVFANTQQSTRNRIPAERQP